MVTVRVLRTCLVFADQDEEVDSAKRTRSVPPDCRASQEAFPSASATNLDATFSHPAVTDPEEKVRVRAPAQSSSKRVVNRFRQELRLVETDDAGDAAGESGRAYLRGDGTSAASCSSETEEVCAAAEVQQPSLQAARGRSPVSHVEGNTVMIRNISCHLKKEDIQRILADAGLAYMYNDIHLPRNVGFSANRGYFFLNFRSSEGVQRCIAALHGESFGNGAGDKRVEVVPADVQGTRRKVRKSRKTNNTA